MLLHTPAGHTSYGLIYRAHGERTKHTLGNTKMLSLGDARALAGQHRATIEQGCDPHAEKIAQREQLKAEQQHSGEEEKLDVELLWSKHMQLVASQLRTKGEKDRIFRKYILPSVKGLSVREIGRRHALEIIDVLVAENKRRMSDGAAAAVLCTEAGLRRLGAKARAVKLRACILGALVDREPDELDRHIGRVPAGLHLRLSDA